jgi:hypothetical protein
MAPYGDAKEGLCGRVDELAAGGVVSTEEEFFHGECRSLELLVK